MYVYIWYLNYRVWTFVSSHFVYIYTDDLAQDCSSSSVLAMELLQSCSKPSICITLIILNKTDVSYKPYE